MNQVITANRLRDGAVLFLGESLRWVDHLSDAEAFVTVESCAAALQAAQKDEAGNLVLDIYAIDIADQHGVRTPVKLREAIRAQGPTVHPEHGKAVGSVKNG